MIILSIFDQVLNSYVLFLRNDFCFSLIVLSIASGIFLVIRKIIRGF